jgi:hypothetical protein
MSFEESLRTIVGTLVVAQRQAAQSEERVRTVVAYHAPYLLRRFADLAAAFAAPALRAGQGAIFARRDAYGYHTVEFVANDLHIVFEVFEGGAHLFWLAGGMSDDRPITMETPGEVIDALLLAAVCAYAQGHAGAAGSGAQGERTQEAGHV